MKARLKTHKFRLLRQLSLAGLIIAIRLTGWLQPYEWQTLDTFLRWRPAESVDPYITLVFITEENIRDSGRYPISDGDLAALIETLQAYQPRVVGIDIFRDGPVDEGADDLKQALTSSPNVVVIDAIGEIDGISIKALDFLPDEQVGFADVVVDSDGAVRINQLGESASEFCVSAECYRFSFSIQIVRKYLAVDGYSLEQGQRNPDAMRFGNTEIPHFQPNTGGYVRADDGGNQALINFRAGADPFTQITYTDLMSDTLSFRQKSALLQDKVVLVAYSADSVKDFITSFAVRADNPGLIPAVLVQSHTISQILNAVYHQRSLLRALPESIECGLILISGFVGICFAHWQKKPLYYWIFFAFALSLVWLLGYPFLIVGWWLPVVPMTLAFGLSAVILFPLIQVQRQLQAQQEETARIIAAVYSTIHNGPMQAFVNLLREWPAGQPLSAQKRESFQDGYAELRDVHRHLRAEMLSSAENVVLSDGEVMPSTLALHEMLRVSYQHKKRQYRTFFSHVVQVPRFDPIDDSALSKREKQLIIRFFEEALTNVYKHAEGATQIKISCKVKNSRNIVQVIDDGSSPLSQAAGSRVVSAEKGSTLGGFGTSHAQQTAKQLNGQFLRSSIEPRGTRCELSWPISSSLWRSRLRRFAALVERRRRFRRK